MLHHLGTVGFSYSDWAGVFYPRDLKVAEYLAFYSRYFDAVELDTTFHAVPEAQTVRRWATMAAEQFRFAVKCPASITHGPRIDEQVAPMLWFLEVMRELGPKLGPVLLQFPPSFAVAEFDRLTNFLPHLPKDVRYAIEFRNSSWQTDATTQLLKENRCCWAVGDYASKPEPVRVTTDFLFVRWIGVHQRFARLDHEQEDVSERLQWWTTQFANVPTSVRDIWGFVNNDYNGYAIGAANHLKRLLDLPVREPKPEERGELFG